MNESIVSSIHDRQQKTVTENSGRPALLLASSSPRRADLLSALDFDFTVLPAAACAVDETALPDEVPADLVARLARAKAEQALRWDELPQRAVILAGDTIVVHSGRILGKPRGVEDAVRMLTDLSGRTHQVLTSLAVANREKCRVLTVQTSVELMSLSPELITAYVATGEPMDKAGAYALQGRAAQFVRRIEGSWGAVVGLPQYEVAWLLAEFGITPRWAWEQTSI